MLQLSLHGKCLVNYYVTSNKEGSYSVEKERDVDSCRREVEGKDVGRWRTFIQTQKCGDPANNQVF